METNCTWVEGVDSGERFEYAGIIPPQKGPHSHRHFIFSDGEHVLFFCFCLYFFAVLVASSVKTDNLKSFGAVSLLVHSWMLLSLKKENSIVIITDARYHFVAGSKIFHPDP